MSLFRSPLIIIDTETTGLLDDRDATPWEIAAVVVDANGNEIDHTTIMGCPAPYLERMRRIIGLGGLDPDEVLSAPPISDHIPMIRKWSEPYITGGARLTAFNVAFDAPMLARVGLDLAGAPWAPCIMETAKKAMGCSGALPWMDRYRDWKMPRLSEAANFYDVPQQEPAHRALADARTAALIAVAMQRRALERSPPPPQE